MIRLGRHVILHGMRPELGVAISVASSVASYLSHQWGQEVICEITSVCDREHSRKSLHYQGLAFDCKFLELGPTSERNVNDVAHPTLAVWLGHDFDCVLEPTHIHTEYDRRRPAVVQRRFQA